MDESTLIELKIDERSVKVPKGTTVYQAAKQLGIEIPIFCYHDKMPPFGACRMCLVEVEKMGKLQASCTLEAQNGMQVYTQTKMAQEGRKDILELLLINHPLDCPICDRGGECPLQDNTLKYGPGLSRFFEEKRHFKKPYSLGPQLALDRERCIVCARCTRFSDLISGDHALEFINRGFRTEVGTKDGEPVKSKFIGNTIMICPVGALTSQVYRFRARPWDNDTTDSTCPLCPVGCSLKLDARDGEIMRTRSKANPAVNDIWLCDKGWFGYEHDASRKRLDSPLIREHGELRQASWNEAISLIAEKIKRYKPNKKIAALGGNPLTTEDSYLFQQLMRKGAETPHLDHRVGMPIYSLEEEGLAAGMDMPIADLERASLIILLGLNITEEFPVLWLRIQQAIHQGAEVIFIGHWAPEIAPHLAQVITHAPGDELEAIKTHLSNKAASGILLVGSQYLASFQRKAILAELSSYTRFKLNLMEGSGNSMGARWAGMRPDLGPQGQKSEINGLNALELLEEMQKGWDLLYVAGSNPKAKFSKAKWDLARKNLNFLIVQDLFMSETAMEADVVLPTLAYTEKKGSFINIEGRIQHLMAGKAVPENVYSDGEIFLQIAQKLNSPLMFDKEFQSSLKNEHIPQKRSSFNVQEINQAPAGELRASFTTFLFNQGVRMEHNAHLRELVKTPPIKIHPSEGEKRHLKNGNTVILKSNDYAFETLLEFDQSVAKNTIIIPLGFKDIPAHELSPNFINGTSIELEEVK